MLKIYLSLLLLLPAILAGAQKKGTTPADTATTTREIYGFQEKVYLHTYSSVLKDDSPQLVVTTDKEAYAQREKVDLSLSLANTDDKSFPKTYLSIAVSDTKSVLNDRAADNILSNLLLCSDIKGNIEKPGYYFDTDIDKTERMQNLELLIFTQGWKRFNIGKYRK